MSASTGGVDYGTELGTHTFLPWIRRGVGTQIDRVDGDATSAARTTLPVTVAVGGGPLSTAAGPVSVPLALYGPGDVTALDPRTVIRTWPRPNVFQAEPNFFPLIELQPADLPWRYTPARANAQDRLRPWVSLIVLRDDEIASQTATTVTVKQASVLPPLSQSWAWAHVQITGESSVDEATVLNLLDTNPHQILARLVCPRRLDPRTAYTGFLVPALRRGVLAGLSQPVPDTVDDTAPAWTGGDTNVQLPTYYRWRFTTGDEGDFESLVRRVQPRTMPSTVGSRPMDETTPGLALPAAAPTPLNAEAALRALDSASTEWDASAENSWMSALEAVLNRPAQLLAGPGAERVVAPPLYGRWYAARDSVDSAAAPQWWFSDLNIDPRMRVGGGLGTLVIQNDQPKYLAGAWAQVAGIRAANAALRAAQLAREAALQIYDRHLTVRSDVSVIASTAPVHSRILTSPRTVAALVNQSPLVAGLLRPAWRRLTRARGPLGLRIGRAGTPSGLPLLERVNAGTKRIAPPPPTPTRLATLSRVGASLAPSWVTPGTIAKIQSLAQLSPSALLVALLVAALLWVLVGVAIGIVFALVITALRLWGNAITNSGPMQDLERRVALRSGTLTAEQITTAPMRPAFVPVELAGAAAVQPSLAAGTTEQPSAARFRTAAAAMFTAFHSPVAAGPVLRPIDLPTLRTKIVAALDPRTTVPATFRERLVLARNLPWAYTDPLEPVMAAPTFTDAMYRPLYGVSPDWLLPGLDQVPQDTVSLVRTNQRFVESYMVGLNHEMARTLLFNEYPTDQRGTYFQRFWDSSATVPPNAAPIDPTTLDDIKPIDAWGGVSPLGGNSSRPKPQGGDYLVLLLRSEILRRYPNLVVYASRAKWNPQGTRDVDDSIESPHLFEGRLGLGVGFWGFDLTVSQVKGGPATKDDPGWFFILQEPPTEPRCGLEPPGVFGQQPANWPDLAWSDLAADATALGGLTYIDLDAALPDTKAVNDTKAAAWHADAGTGPTGARASDLAYITYRVPIRIAVHASLMIPPDAVGS
jgi:hypothetical protein